MSINKNALIRYKTIDHCLQNRYRKWSLEDLIDACSDALYEYEGIDGVSKRTVQADIQIMRSNKLGYNAPIIIVERKYYTYADSSYSITNIPLSDQDLAKLGEAVAFLKQFQGFSHFNELSGMVQKLEDQIYAQKTNTQPVIDFEKNENLKGLQFLDFFYKAIIKKQALEITYKSFKARNENTFTFHAYLLKEFNNRWFVIGRKNVNDTILNLAIDRVIDVSYSNKVIFLENEKFNPETYYKNVIGVSVSPTLKANIVKLFVTHKHAPYVITKPLHWSQKTIEKNFYGVVISLEVQHNFELEKKILGLGDGVKVISPESLRKSIEGRIKGALDLYETDISNKGLTSNKEQVKLRGFNILNQVFTQRSIRKVDAIIYKHNKASGIDLNINFKIENLFSINENIEKLLFSETYLKVLESISKDFKLINTIYIDICKQYQSDWRQEKNTFKIIIALSAFNNKLGSVRLFNGSHKKIITKQRIDIIQESNLPFICEIPKNGLLILNSQTIHQFYKTEAKQRMRYIILEYKV